MKRSNARVKAGGVNGKEGRVSPICEARIKAAGIYRPDELRPEDIITGAGVYYYASPPVGRIRLFYP